jgi:uncharacterized damage-inducible protein DinB
MDTIKQLRRFLDYDVWANRETIKALKQSPDPPPRSVKIMAHILAAQDLWLVRLKKTGKPVVVWPEFSVDQLETQMERIIQEWSEYLGGLNSSRLSEQISYKNSKGESWTNTVEDILLHLTMHSNYHRGQVALDLRVSGLVPPYTDFIHSVRQGIIESS